MLDELMRYDDRAVLTVSPNVGDSGETLRWVLLTDGEAVPALDIRVRPDSERPEVMVMLLVGDGELELERWSTTGKYEHGPGAVLRTVGDLRRRESKDSTGDSTA
jgi:hypothetical protein